MDHTIYVYRKKDTYELVNKFGDRKEAAEYYGTSVQNVQYWLTKGKEEEKPRYLFTREKGLDEQ